MHLVVYFCGTGNAGNGFPGHYDYVDPRKGVRTIFVKGCDEPEVCNSLLFPNLKEFANRFVNKLFKREDNELKLGVVKTVGDEKDPKNTPENNLLKSIGIKLGRTDIESDVKDEEIESITLCGYSRGAATCFEVAKRLNQIAPTVPVDIVADQPVPGNFYQGPLTNAGSIADCSDLKNLRNVSVILGAYTGAIENVTLHTKKEIPKDLTRYKNSYLLVGEPPFYTAEKTKEAQAAETETETEEIKEKEIDKINAKAYYVNDQGELREVSLNHTFIHPAQTLKGLGVDNSKERKYSIDPQNFKVMIDDLPAEARRVSTDSISHRNFFSQILPKLPRKTHRDIIVIPRTHHNQANINDPTGEEHMHMQVAKYLNAKKLDLVSDDAVERKTYIARAMYRIFGNESPALYPVASQLQSFFGLKKESVYRYLDKLHPKAFERQGMQWDSTKESLSDWWQRHDKHTSRFSTPLTKALVKSLKEIDLENKEELIELFKQTDCWLMLKENSSTSRYYQVEGLRAHIMQYLEENHRVSKHEIAQLNRGSMEKTGYFLKHWSEGSKAASFLQTKATDRLDEAFQKHSKEPQSEKSDRELLKALDTWLEEKDKSSKKSSRYDLVIEMYEHLSEVIENNYGPAVEEVLQVKR